MFCKIPITGVVLQKKLNLLALTVWYLSLDWDWDEIEMRLRHLWKYQYCQCWWFTRTLAESLDQELLRVSIDVKTSVKSGEAISTWPSNQVKSWYRYRSQSRPWTQPVSTVETSMPTENSFNFQLSSFKLISYKINCLKYARDSVNFHIFVMSQVFSVFWFYLCVGKFLQSKSNWFWY